ncbi:uncharacterized protein [Zea mays]|uniref:Uncharacterized protein n=1 Tax=Zea mays TaxID=4577 RepID=A0A1D6Q6I3_MAIZE|nr:uncharacterized protein LOC103653878 [Zea mays]AQK54121.1 hypothetical protein ZEAMMB73_Zm00001d051386 [Zea mays]|eukprot:XP_008678908.1 uncharacterized protein LOC103653878 [Zea mays]
MFSVSSLLALTLKGKLRLTATDLLVVFILTLYVTNCKARHLRVHGKHCSSKLTSSPPKGVVDGGAANKGDMRSSSSSSEIPVGSKMGASTANEAVAAKKKDVTTSPGDSCRASLRKAFERIKVRSSGTGVPAGADGSNGEQVGSNTATAETLVAMDYLDARPAPAVHNR